MTGRTQDSDTGSRVRGAHTALAEGAGEWTSGTSVVWALPGVIDTTQQEAGEHSAVGQCSQRGRFWEQQLGRKGLREYQALDPNCHCSGGGSRITELEDQY